MVVQHHGTIRRDVEQRPSDSVGAHIVLHGAYIPDEYGGPKACRTFPMISGLDRAPALPTESLICSAAAFRLASACNSAMTCPQRAHWTAAIELSSAGIDTAGLPHLVQANCTNDIIKGSVRAGLGIPAHPCARFTRRRKV